MLSPLSFLSAYYLYRADHTTVFTYEYKINIETSDNNEFYLNIPFPFTEPDKISKKNIIDINVVNNTKFGNTLYIHGKGNSSLSMEFKRIIRFSENENYNLNLLYFDEDHPYIINYSSKENATLSLEYDGNYTNIGDCGTDYSNYANTVLKNGTNYVIIWDNSINWDGTNLNEEIATVLCILGSLFVILSIIIVLIFFYRTNNDKLKQTDVLNKESINYDKK